MSRSSRLLIVITLLVVPTATLAQGPQSALAIDGPVVDGDCRITILGAIDWGQQFRLGQQETRVDWARQESRSYVVVRTAVPLEAGQTVSVNYRDTAGRWLAPVVVQPKGAGPVRTAAEGCVTDPRPVDERPVVSTVGWVGFISETFSPQASELRSAFASSGSLETAPLSESSTITGRPGFDFDIQGKLVGDRDQQLWFRARATYGAQQALVCTSNGNAAGAPAACDANGVPNPNQALVIAKNADTVEAYFGVRYELYRLPKSGLPGSVYATCGLGNLFILGIGGKALDHNHCGVGMMFTSGRLMGTSFEFSRGNSEVFAPDRSKWDRSRADVFLSFRFMDFDRRAMGLVKSMRPFFAFSIDRGPGVDSYTTTFGFGVDAAKLFTAF